ncbi:MAG: SDR family oxidoreductase [Longimicrobiales bacterium]
MPDLALDASTALVTGASRGIGRAVAGRLSDAGARVFLVSRGGAALDAAADAVGGVAIAADVSDESAIAALAARVRQEVGGVPDIVVNSAGAFALAPLAETPTRMFDEQLAVNLRGPFLAIQAFLPGMLARRSGHIVTVGSVAGRQAFPDNGAYSASKFGVRGLHAVLDTEIRGTGVRATLVEPAATDTPLWDAIDRERHGDLPPREAMLPAAAVADAVLYALTRPAGVAVRAIVLERA